jgi:hypothetical protein
MSFFYKLIQKIATWCQLLIPTNMKNRFAEGKKTPEPRSRPDGPRSGPCSALPACRGQGRLSRNVSRALPPGWSRSRSLEPRCLPSCDGVEGGGGVTPPLNANIVVVPMRRWWSDTGLTVHTFIFRASVYPAIYSGSISQKVFTTTSSASSITRSTSPASPCTMDQPSL